MDQENNLNSEDNIEETDKSVQNANDEEIHEVETSHAETDKNLVNSHNDTDEAWFFRTRNIIYYILGVIEVLLSFRLIFRSLGANAQNGMVELLYAITKALIAPFSGIFNIINPTGAGQYIIEPAVVIAMVVYALLAYGLVKLIKVTAVSV